MGCMQPWAMVHGHCPGSQPWVIWFRILVVVNVSVVGMQSTTPNHGMHLIERGADGFQNVWPPASDTTTLHPDGSARNVLLWKPNKRKSGKGMWVARHDRGFHYEWCHQALRFADRNTARMCLYVFNQGTTTPNDSHE